MRRFSQRKLLRAIDIDRVRAAIEKAEKTTSGEIRVSISRFFWGDVHTVAEKAFRRLGMAATAQRNAILFFVVPSRRRFAVIGDSGIHAKVGHAFWEKTVGEMSAYFRRGEFTAGLVAGIEEAGKQLAGHFPYDAGTDVNELPDEVDLP